MITYGYTILYVADVEKTIAFYVDAFGFAQKFITPEKDYAELETGGTTLAFASYSIAEYNGVAIAKSDAGMLPPPAEIAFVVEDLAAAFSKATQAGAKVVKEPEQKPWGQTIAYVADINGFLVELCTKMS